MRAAFCFLVLTTWGTVAVAQPGTKPGPRKAAPPASAASTVLRAEPPVTSPVVRASEESQVPGDFRPEKRVVPQVAVPLRRERPPPVATPGSAASAAPAADAAARRAAQRPLSIKR